MVIYCPSVNPGKTNGTVCPYNATTKSYMCTAPNDHFPATLSGGCFTAENEARSLQIGDLQNRLIVSFWEEDVVSGTSSSRLFLRLSLSPPSTSSWPLCLLASLSE